MRFTDREKAFEDKFAHDEEILFKVRAKRNKDAGLWAAEKMGKKGDEAHQYADHLVISMLDKEKLRDKLKNDMETAGITIADTELFTKLDGFVVAARQYFMEG